MERIREERRKGEANIKSWRKGDQRGVCKQKAERKSKKRGKQMMKGEMERAGRDGEREGGRARYTGRERDSRTHTNEERSYAIDRLRTISVILTGH
jgi:hypothetical protein